MMEGNVSSALDMERRLLEAAIAGNFEDLLQLLNENPFILHTTGMLSASHNPLQIATIAGHTDFAKKILKWNPSLAKELNQDGFSPIHLASAHGYLEIVKEMLKIDKELCRLEGRQRRTPLHYAAIKGKVGVVTEMLLACPDCVGDVTSENETALHLAVKHGQWEVIKFLVEWTRNNGKIDVLNHRDERGNTVLHLATWKKQRKVIELLLGHGESSNQEILLEINALNLTSLTALDLLLLFPSEAGDREIAGILTDAGAKSAARDQVVLSGVASSGSDNTNNQSTSTPQHEHRTSTPQPKNFLEYFKFKKGRDSPSEARNALLVVAVLVATSTFQVGLSPPGSVFQDGNLAGKSIMGAESATSYAILMIFNSIGFTVSLVMINILTCNFPLRLELQVCSVAMFFTYSTAITSIAPNSLKLSLVIFTSVFPVVAENVIKLMRVVGVRVIKSIASIIRKTG